MNGMLFKGLQASRFWDLGRFFVLPYIACPRYPYIRVYRLYDIMIFNIIKMVLMLSEINHFAYFVYFVAYWFDEDPKEMEPRALQPNGKKVQ